MVKPLPKLTTLAKIRLGFWIFGVFIALVQMMRYRYSLSSEDIISYLDVADYYVAGDWANAINGNWSPLYSWIFALFFWIFQPSGAWEFPLVKLVNFLIFLFAFASFDFFLREFVQYAKRFSTTRLKRPFLIPEWVWFCLGYTLFLFTSLVWLGIYCDTPDMLTVGLVYLAAGLILNITRQPDNWLTFIGLGVVLGFGYFSKAVMFPLAFVFFTVALVSVGNLRRALPRILVAFCVFLLVISPYVGALSLKKGKLTFSETGKLSYIWFVHPTWRVIPDQFWQGEPPEFGTPKHPLRKLTERPALYEFAEPIGGTFPLWTDPSYWYEGIIAKFNLKAIVRIMILNLLYYYKAFLGILLFSYLVFLLWSQRPWQGVRDLTAGWQLLLPAIAGLGAYLVATDFHANTMTHQLPLRFLASFVVLLFAGVFATIQLPKLRSTRIVMTSLTIATVVAVGLQLLAPTLKEALEIVTERQENLHWQVATEMQQVGVQPGGRVAIFGLEDEHVYWARLARTKIVAQLEETDQFWASDAPVRAEILQAAAKAGASAVVHKGKPLRLEDLPQWQPLGDTGYYAHRLGSAQAVSDSGQPSM